MTTIPKQRIYEGHLLSGDRRVFILGILVLSVMWNVVWDSMSTLTYYLQNPTIVGFPHFSQISPW